MIVIIAKHDDEHALMVKQLLEAEHREAVHILDTSRFPAAAQLNARFRDTGSLIQLRDLEIEIDLGNVKSFWWRRPQAFAIDDAIADPTTRQFTYSECQTALHGSLSACKGMWVNDIHRDDAADYKPRQLQVANAVGFRLPDTLISNDPQTVIDFWNEQQGAVIYKAFNQRAIVWRPARRLRQEDLQLVHTVAAAPVIFQALVPGNRDLRVTVVGKQIFAAEFTLPESEAIDCRVHLGTAPCGAHELPAHLIEKIHAFMARLGLEYGAIDFRLTPDNEYFFFEVNTGGEFLYVQHRTQQPIAQAVAAHLARGVPANPPSGMHAE